MPVFTSMELCAALEKDVQALADKAEALKALRTETLNQQPAPGSWSIVQVLEHLNSYNRYYLPQIEKALQQGRARRVKVSPSFRSGWFGNYFTNMMKPSADGSLRKKYQAPKDHVPPSRLDPRQVIAEFLEGCERLKDFLQQARHTDIGRLKVPISISRWIKLKLGDVFRFLIGHQQRHFLQIGRIYKL